MTSLMVPRAGAFHARLRMWAERGRPLRPWLPALAVGAALDLLFWLVA